ncbi:MAG: hypothetical protein WCP73_02995 [Eubacteriales bacterium]
MNQNQYNVQRIEQKGLNKEEINSLFLRFVIFFTQNVEVFIKTNFIEFLDKNKQFIPEKVLAIQKEDLFFKLINTAFVYAGITKYDKVNKNYQLTEFGSREIEKNGINDNAKKIMAILSYLMIHQLQNSNKIVDINQMKVALQKNVVHSSLFALEGFMYDTEQDIKINKEIYDNESDSIGNDKSVYVEESIEADNKKKENLKNFKYFHVMKSKYIGFLISTMLQLKTIEYTAMFTNTTDKRKDFLCSVLGEQMKYMHDNVEDFFKPMPLMMFSQNFYNFQDSLKNIQNKLQKKYGNFSQCLLQLEIYAQKCKEELTQEEPGDLLEKMTNTINNKEIATYFYTKSQLEQFEKLIKENNQEDDGKKLYLSMIFEQHIQDMYKF